MNPQKENNHCFECDKSYDLLSQHWYYNPEHRPEFSEKQMDILKGILMSDGYIDSTSSNPRLVLNTINKEYLIYLNEVFGNLSCGIKSIKESTENTEEVFTWRTRTHPGLNKLKEWYSSGEKVWPVSDIQMNSTIFKHLYVGDGHYEKYGSDDYISIAAKNEYHNHESIEEMFERWKFSVNNCSRYKSESHPEGTMDIKFDTKTSHELWEFIEVVPGFDYKWPKKYR